MKEKAKSIGRILLFPISFLYLIFKVLSSLVRELLVGIGSPGAALVMAGILLCSTAAALGGGIVFMNNHKFLPAGILAGLALLLSAAIGWSSLSSKTNIPFLVRSSLSSETDDPPLVKGLATLLGFGALVLTGFGLYLVFGENNVYRGWILAGNGMAMFCALALGVLIKIFEIIWGK